MLKREYLIEIILREFENDLLSTVEPVNRKELEILDLDQLCDIADNLGIL